VPKKSKFPILRRAWPRIIDYRSTPLRSIMVDGRRRGNGKREYFRKPSDAKTRADQLAVERENHGTALLDFPARDRVMAVECRELLRPFGRTIREATLQFIAHLESERTNAKLPLIRDCAAQYLVARQRDFERKELSSRSVAEARQCMQRLTSVIGDELITSLNVERVRAYLDSFPLSAISRHDLRLRLSGFCSFCKPWLATARSSVKNSARRSTFCAVTIVSRS
jgi:hypothetical protein